MELFNVFYCYRFTNVFLKFLYASNNDDDECFEHHLELHPPRDVVNNARIDEMDCFRYIYVSGFLGMDVKVVFTV